MSWTDERIDQLKALWDKGLTASQIAEELGGVSRNAVIGKAHRLGLKSRPSPVKANDADKKAVPKKAAPAPAPAKAPAAAAPARPRPAAPVAEPVPPVRADDDAAEAPAPQVPHKMAQRRIDLLGIEQNAWVLAARDNRCVVVSTRTELDWAMRHQRMSVWAPSKIVLDAVDGPSASPRDALALVHWFARAMKADSLLVIGEAAPVGQDLPLRAVATDVHLLP